jgi:diguanylate cyclase (GGDEF)-like protein
MGEFAKESEENFIRIDRKISNINKILKTLSNLGATYYKEDLNSGNMNQNYKYILYKKLYIYNNKSNCTIAKNVKTPENLSLKKEFDMLKVMNYNYESISEMIPSIKYISYISNEKFINIFPEVTPDKYDYFNKICDINFIEEEFLKNTILWSDVYKDPLENGFIVTASIPIYNKNIFKGLLTLNIESEYFGKYFNGKTSTKFFLLDKKSNVLPDENNDGGEISEFYKEIPEELYEKRYKFQDMKPSTVVKIGKYYIYYKSFSQVPWKVYYITDNYQIHKEIFEKNIFFISLWFFLVVILLDTFKREAFISDSKKAIKKLDGMLKKSHTEMDKDFLTGALNRKGFIKIANFEFSRMERYDVKSAILMLDIDYFKKINDTYGHACGDFILKGVVKLFIKNVRLNDVVCRWGGEEFLILLTETDYEGALLAGEKIRKVIERQGFHYHGREIRLTITIGVSTLNSGKTLDHSIEQSDQALYSGKTNGRNRVVGYRELENNT